MNPSRPFIHRPVATALVMLTILLVGIVAYRLLPMSALPQFDYPTIQVVTLYPGASPAVAASSITAPLERQFGQMPGLRQTSSTSSAGVSVITLQFALDLELDVAEQEVQAAINAATNFLPADLPQLPIYNKVNPADTPIITLALTSRTLPLTEIQQLADTRLAGRLSQVSGVGLVSIGGGQRPAVRIEANPRALAAYGLSLDDIRRAVQGANANQAKGGFDGPLRAATIDANDQLRRADEYKAVVVAYRNAAAVRLGDVAEISDGVENARLAAWVNQSAAVIVNVQRQPGANVIDVADRIKRQLPQLEAALPAAVDLVLLTDRTETIRASVRDVQFELLLAVALVVMIIFVFLRSVAATVIPGVVVPLSLIGTFGVMYLAGFSINNLTLMALTIATGFVVDDAIVMIENISRHIEAGEPPLQAALKGAEQIGFTIISLTVSLVAVLIPLLFMGDVIGRLFREFAITLAVAILISAFISLTLTPMMCARLLRPAPRAAQGGASPAQHSSGFFARLVASYGRMLTWVLDRQGLTLWVALATLALTVWLYVVIPKGFFPVQDTGAIQGISQAPPATSFAAMARHQQALGSIILDDPAVQSFSSFIGVDGINATLNSGRFLINLKPLEQRRDSASVVIARLQRALAGRDGIELYMQPVQDLTIEDKVSRTQYQFSVEDADAEVLRAWMPRLIERLRQDTRLAAVASDQQEGGLQAYVEIDRDAAARYGVTPAAVSEALYNAFGQRQISTIFTQTNQYRVVLEVLPQFRNGLAALDSVFVPAGNASGAPRSATGTAPRSASSQAGAAQIPLSSIARVVERSAPLVITRANQFPAATVSFNLGPDTSLGEAVRAVEAARSEIGMPASVQLRFQGAALAFQASLANQLWLILAAIVTVYIVLGVLYESYIHPITILSTLPSAGVGALLALLLSGDDLGVISIIGIVLLIGIVKKNAIMMIDFALDAERTQSMAPREAIFQACLLRLRPILMTTMAALLGALPLMLGSGMGSELRNPLGIALVGGLIVSQALTLFTTPVIYLAFDRLARRVSSRRRRSGAEPLPGQTS